MKGANESADTAITRTGRRTPDGRRFAILDDNQSKLDIQIRALAVELPALLRARIAALMLIGSVVRGVAKDGSDLDLLVVLRSGTPVRSDYGWWDSEVAPRMTPRAGGPFPVNPLFVAREATHTSEPALGRAIAEGLVLWDADGIFES